MYFACVLCHFAFEQQGVSQLTLTSKVAALDYSSIESMKLKLTCLLNVGAGAHFLSEYYNLKTLFTENYLPI